MVTRAPGRGGVTPTLADEWDAIHTILGPLLSEAGAAERRGAVLARHAAPRLTATLAELDQVIEQLMVRMRTEPKGKAREDTRQHQRVPTQPPADGRPPSKPITRPTERPEPTRPPPTPEQKPVERPVSRPTERPAPKDALVPPPIPIKPPTKSQMPAVADELDGVPPLPPADSPPKKRPTGVRPAIGFDESGALVPAKSGTAPETFLLYDDIVTLSGLNDWDGVLISLERLLVMARLEDHVKEFVDANEVKLLSIYETFLKSFARVPKRLQASIDNSMPRPFLRAEKIAAILQMVDGKATIQDMLKRSALSPLETCSALCQLRRAGVVEVP